MKTFVIMLFFFLTYGQSGVVQAQEKKMEIVWRDALQFEIEGKGWSVTEDPYDRFPIRAKATVPEGVWGLSKHSAGLCVRFQTNAPSVAVRWDVTGDNLAMPHMPATGVSGVDLYCRIRGKWRFVQNGRPTQATGNSLNAALPSGAGTPVECLLYLPLYNGVKKLEIGVATGYELSKSAERPQGKRAPVVIYGTSIVQGGCASRPGMAYTALLGRQLDRPVINLGFSGSGRMEPAVSDLLAELDPAVYVIDCLWNMGDLSETEITLRISTLVTTIRKSHPRTPLLFVGQSQSPVGLPPTKNEKLQAQVVKALRAKGIPELYLCPGKSLLGDDGEGTVDGVHPNDLGMRRHADVLAPIISRIFSFP